MAQRQYPPCERCDQRISRLDVFDLCSVCHSQDLLRAERRERDEEVARNERGDSASLISEAQSLKHLPIQPTPGSVIAQTSGSHLSSGRDSPEQHRSPPTAPRAMQYLSTRPRPSSIVDQGMNDSQQALVSGQPIQSRRTTEVPHHRRAVSPEHVHPRTEPTRSGLSGKLGEHATRSARPKDVLHSTSKQHPLLAKPVRQSLATPRKLQGKRGRSRERSDLERRVRPRGELGQCRSTSSFSMRGNIYPPSRQLSRPIALDISMPSEGHLSAKTLPIRPCELQGYVPKLEVAMYLSKANNVAEDRKRVRPSNTLEVYAALRRFQDSLEQQDQGWRSHCNATQDIALDSLAATMQVHRKQREHIPRMKNIWRDESRGLKHLMESYIAELTEIAHKLLRR